MVHYRSRGIDVEGPDRAIVYSDGATLTVPTGPRSHYDGLLCQRYDRTRGFWAIKILDSIHFEAGAIEQITCGTRTLIVEYESGLIVAYTLESTSRSTTLMVRMSEPASGTLRFDMRHVYDSEPFHKHYVLEPMSGGSKAYTLSFTKESVHDTRYDISETVRFGLYGARVSDERIERWTIIDDGFDARRSGTDAKHHVYEPVRFTGCETIILTTKTRLTRIDEPATDDHVSDRRSLARTAAREQLAGSILARGSAKHVLAGSPWFFHEWSRDTGVSIGGLRSVLGASERVNILIRLAKSLAENEASIQSDATSLRAADAMGLVMWRLSEEELSASKRKAVAKILEEHLHTLEARLVDGLLTNGERETWMDTGAGFRAGSCIEIQALYARMLSYAFELTHYLHYAERREKLIGRVRERFIGDDGRIIDHIDPEGNPSSFATPNPFLAYVVSPDLFENGTWIWTFDEWLVRLSAEETPGMLFSLEERSPLFRPYHEGANDESYHRGDSWLFMNHLAAIALARLDRERYRERIEAIIDASVHDCLELGAFLGLSEVSSAHRQDSNGCWAQTWSAATLLELLDTL
jgi:hypothetical protein